MKRITAFLLALYLLSGAEMQGLAADTEEIAGESGTEERGSSIFDLLDAEEALNYEIDMAEYYLTDMADAAAEGNVRAGRAAEENRRAAIAAQSIQAEEISFDDLYLLSRIIFSEAGSYWLSEEFRMSVGEVVLNRVASPEFPDNLYDVVYQKGQYAVVNTAGFNTLAPGKDCVDTALRLLRGERIMVPSVVYQSDYVQGELFAVYNDMRLGKTYFCISENIELYPID